MKRSILSPTELASIEEIEEELLEITIELFIS
jgi:hypothetical protein